MRRAVPGGLALAAAMLPLAATAQDAVWDDATVVHAGGGTFLLDRAVNDALSGSPAMRAGMKRIGLKRACAIASAARKQAVAAEEAAYLPALVTTMRAQIPPQRLTGSAFPAFISGPLIGYKARVSAALEHDAEPIYTLAKANALARFTRDAAATPAIKGRWADIFGDWDFRSANAISAACLQYGLSDPASGKRAFDMFYQRKETR